MAIRFPLLQPAVIELAGRNLSLAYLSWLQRQPDGGETSDE